MMKKLMLTGLVLMLVLLLFSVDVSAQGLTNRGKLRMLTWVYRNADSSAVDTFRIMLCTDANTPTTATNTMADLTEIPSGNGYTSGGGADGRLIPNSTDFDAIAENDTDSLATIQIKNIVFTANGGTLPSSGNGARWAVITDNKITIDNRTVFAWWSLGSNRQVSGGQTITLQDLELRFTTP